MGASVSRDRCARQLRERSKWRYPGVVARRIQTYATGRGKPGYLIALNKGYE